MAIASLAHIPYIWVMKMPSILEPKDLKSLMHSLMQSGNGDQSVVWSGNRLPKYLWDAWKDQLKPTGLTWQRFMRLLRYRTDLAVMWYKGAMPWQEFLRKVEELIDGPIGQSQLRGTHTPVRPAQTVNVPIVGTVAAGLPILAEENIEARIPVSTSLARPGSTYFLLRVVGDSMDEIGINDGELVLVRQQPEAEEGDLVVALIDGEATVKEFHRDKGVVLLKPRSNNKRHKPIILTEDFQIQGVVISSIPKME